MRRPARERALVEIVQKICEPPPLQRSVGNMILAADEVYIAEHNTIPSVTAKVHQDRIDMKVTGQKTPRPFVTAAQLETRLGPQERLVLRAHERSMKSLVRRWSRLHPKVAA